MHRILHSKKLSEGERGVKPHVWRAPEAAKSPSCRWPQGTRVSVWGSPTCHSGSPRKRRHPRAGPGPGWGGRGWTRGASGCPGLAGAGCLPGADGAGRPLPAALGWPGWGGAGGRNEGNDAASCSHPEGCSDAPGLSLSQPALGPALPSTDFGTSW